jgi:hypothetical protein
MARDPGATLTRLFSAFELLHAATGVFPIGKTLTFLETTQSRARNPYCLKE